MDYNLRENIEMIQNILNLSNEDLANKVGLSDMAIYRYKNDLTNISDVNLENLYGFAYRENVKLNSIYEQIYKEDYERNNNVILFHGAKEEIEGELSLNHSRDNNDFGKGFYCGESLEQSAMFVSNFEKSSIYFLKFNKDNLREYKFDVDQDWMLTIAFFRNKLNDYKNSEVLKHLIKRLDGVDYIVAPIADNKMFQIIDSFINGEITDEQCRHSLAATNLGYQYVFVSERALKQVEIIYRGYLTKEEKKDYLESRLAANKIGTDKVKMAKIKYRGQGHYIDEIL